MIWHKFFFNFMIAFGEVSFDVLAPVLIEAVAFDFGESSCKIVNSSQHEPIIYVIVGIYINITMKLTTNSKHMAKKKPTGVFQLNGSLCMGDVENECHLVQSKFDFCTTYANGIINRNDSSPKSLMK